MKARKGVVLLLRYSKTSANVTLDRGRAPVFNPVCAFSTPVSQPSGRPRPSLRLKSGVRLLSSDYGLGGVTDVKKVTFPG